MSADLLAPIAAFSRVAHHASFTRAAAELGVSPSALSQTIRKLERSLGVRLLERSTRRVGVTENGQRFLAQAQPGLASLASAIDSVNDSRDKPSGMLRLNLSRTAADILVMPLGGRHRLATVAAPCYLAGRALPNVPQDLVDHRCLNARLGGGIYRWEYLNRGRAMEIEVRGPLIANDGDTLLTAVRAGAGIACAFEAQVQDDIVAGHLVPLLKAWWPTFPGFYLYHPSRTHMPRKLRVFIDFMRGCLQP